MHVPDRTAVSASNSSPHFIPSVVVNTDIVKDSIVLGFSGKPLELLNIQKVKKDNLQVIRRFTGGGTVVVDHSTVFASFVLNVSVLDYFTELRISKLPAMLCNYRQEMSTPNPILGRL